MLAILQSEWFKLRKSKITSIIIIGPLIGLMTGINSPLELKVSVWEQTLLYMNLTYALLFLPLITGVLSSMICRYEHQAGGWKQLLALPVSRGQVFVAKYIILMLIVLVIQILYFCALFAVGIIRGFSDPFPIEIIWKCILGGWIATFPLVALQLWMSILFNSFALPFAVNVIFTLPSILAINSEYVGPYYLWAQPFSMMYIGGETGDVFYIPWEQLITVVGGGFILFFLGGYVYFQRKAV
ncbi:MAG TPA: ABC transporter permease [Rummeliibacillus sp.]|nr:ABC transporter permease [Rummeliibacillus sp.]